jgi:membrane-associated protease RseP (regulator of RpoE activity)
MIKPFNLSVFILLASSLAGLLSGCANTGPAIPREELIAVEKEIENLGSRVYVDDLRRIWKVKYRILKALPPGELGHKRVGIGALIMESSDKVAKAFELQDQDRCVIVAVGEGSPAEQAGLRPKDIIKTVDGVEVEDTEDLEFVEGRQTRLIVEREGKEEAFVVVPEEVPHAKIRLKETDVINAFARFSGVEVTRGMLRFVENDDELAVIIGHEVAHLAHGHLAKNMAIAGLCGFVGGLTGPFAAPVTQALYALYSRETEREADYFGLLYTYRAGYDMERGIELWRRFAVELPKSCSKSFLRTHPATPERILRVKKVLEMIKAGYGEADYKAVREVEKEAEENSQDKRTNSS